MAQPEKSSFLNKLARFVANPTTDWATLDNVPKEPAEKERDKEQTELTPAEIFAIRYQRQKENRDIRIKEFAILRQLRNGNKASAQTAPAVPANGGQGGVVHATVHHTTAMEDFYEKINDIEQQMVDQWWAKPGAEVQAPLAQEQVKDIPKTQMLIESQLAPLNQAIPAPGNSDVIEFDPALLDASPSQAAAQPNMQQQVTASQHAPSAVPSAAMPDVPPVSPLLMQQASTPQPRASVSEERVQHAAMPPLVSEPVAGHRPAATTEPVVLVQGIEEQVDFSADPGEEQDLSAFVYRDVFTEIGEAGGSVLPEVDSSLMPTAFMLGELQQAIELPPDYTPDDLPDSLNEPAILFIQGDHEQTEAKLLELVRAEQEQQAATVSQEEQEPHVTLALLDFYRSTKQEDKFETASIEMVRHFDRSAPQYQGADLGEATRILTTLGAFHDIDHSPQDGWCSPAELDLTDVMLLRAQLMTQQTQVLLDWQALQTILDDAVEPLLDQFSDLAERKVDLLMWGGERLLACCVEKLHALQALGQPLPPLYALLWRLRLELVRIMHGQEDFDHLALEYCVALEESPPSWSRTRCHFIDADSALSLLEDPQKDAQSVVAAGGLSADEKATLKHPLQWKGNLKGNMRALLQAVEVANPNDFCVIDCSQLDSMDYQAAVVLLEWLMAAQNAQRRIQFVQVNRLLAVFWRIMGITANATVKLRRD